jgi:hypothetical protein
MFYRSSTSSDGFGSYCKQCSKAYVLAWKQKNLTDEKLAIYKARFKESNPGYSTQRKKEWAKANPEKFAEQRRRKERRAYEKKMKEKHGPDYVVGDVNNRTGNKQSSISKEEARKRHNARRVTQKAIMKGLLIKQPCFVCGDLQAEAHHPDYSTPMAVSWLCRSHHYQVHEEYRQRV